MSNENKGKDINKQAQPQQPQQPRPAQAAPGQNPGQQPRPNMPPRRPVAPGMAPGGSMQPRQPQPKPISRKMDDAKIKEYLQKVKPRRTFRGVNDEDMWTIVANVQKFYQKEFDMQVARFEAILEEKDREIYNLRMEKK